MSLEFAFGTALWKSSAPYMLNSSFNVLGEVYFEHLFGIGTSLRRLWKPLAGLGEPSEASSVLRLSFKKTIEKILTDFLGLPTQGKCKLTLNPTQSQHVKQRYEMGDVLKRNTGRDKQKHISFAWNSHLVLFSKGCAHIALTVTEMSSRH